MPPLPIGAGVYILPCHRPIYGLDDREDSYGITFDFLLCGTLVDFNKGGDAVVFFSDRTLSHKCLREVKIEHLAPEYKGVLDAKIDSFVLSRKTYTCQTQTFELAMITSIYNNGTSVWANKCNSWRVWSVKLQEDVVIVY